MNWFQRHLNWSLFFGTFILPLCVGLIFAGIWLALLWGKLAPSISSGVEGFSEEVITSVISSYIPLSIIGGFISLAIWIFGLIVMWWYLGQKARSKWFMLLYFIPWGLGTIYNVISRYTDPSAMFFNLVFGLFFVIVGLIDMIIFYCLENKAIGYGGDFAAGSTADLLVPDTGQYSSSDTLQPSKQLDYNPENRVHSIVYGSESPVLGGEVPAAPSGVKAAGSAGWQYASSAPILLDETGAAIKCYYHPESDAVNSCSRCGHYVCSQCNYVTGTHPICHNCWGKPATKSIAATPAGKQEIAKPAQSEEHAESPVSSEPVVPTMAAAYEVPVTSVSPANPHISDIPEASAIPQASEISAPPEITAVPAEPDSAVAPPASAVPTVPPPIAPAVSTTPEGPVIATEPAVSAAPAIPEIPVQQQETPKLTKLDRRKAEDDERFRQFMLLYEQALPFIGAVVNKSPEGLLPSPLDLMEGLKLGPMLKYAKKLPKPKEKELQEAKKLFEQLLDACVKVGEKAADFVSSSGHVIPTEANFTRLADGVEKASVLMVELTRKLPPPSLPQI